MNIFFDTIIFGFLTINGFVIVIFLLQALRRPKLLQQKLYYILLGVLLLFFSVVFYGSFIEPRIITVTENEIDLGGKTELKAVLIADFHVGPYKTEKFVKKVVKKINEISPDVVFIAGDFLFASREITEPLTALKDLNAPLGKFAVLGNHDYFISKPINDETAEKRANLVLSELHNAEIDVLVNETRFVSKNGSKLQILGLKEILTKDIPLKNLLDSLDKNIPSIILCHNPDIVLILNKNDTDLILSAHTHAGQIRLPFWGSIPTIPTKLGDSYDQGLFSYNETPLFITRGIGEMGPRARLFAPPEIAVLNIKY